ncbi:adenylosuccinate synthetase [Methanocaldococcus indicus]|uniref:adenylosuccinate synthetase n=1 Tax=Methanocaldococcus indicus TaxID=213231 RepID=UPI003C6D1C68
MSCLIIVGGQWGDEGKGKVISYICSKDKPDVIARGGVGPNAGHTVNVKGKSYGIRMVPTGFPHKEAKLAIGAGVLVDPEVLLKEVEMLKEFNVKERLIVDYRAGIIEEKHKLMDRQDEHLSKEIGTTGSGCGPANVDRVLRILKQAKDIEELKEFLGDVSELLNDTLDNGGDVLIEGTQGTFLSLYYGTYPYVTSKDTTASSFAADVGIGPTKVDDVLVVFKSYPTRVGAGPFPTEMSEEEAERLGLVEYGTVTGRRRRVGYFDFEMAKKACRLNGATQIAITGLDKYDKSCYGVREYNKLTKKARDFIEKIEEVTKVPVTIISTGPGMNQTIDLRAEKL